MTAIARSGAYEVLLDVVQRGKYSNVGLQQYYRRHALDERDRALCTEIVYGTLQYQRSIDALLEPLCRRGLVDMDERVLVILRMAVYQLGYLSRVPGYAVLNDAVELCKKHARKASGFVNGVLRSFTRDKRSVSEKLAAIVKNVPDTATRLGILFSYPDWFVRELLDEYKEQRTVLILESGNEPATMSLRVNKTKLSVEEFLKSEDMNADERVEPSLVSPDGVRLRQGIDIEHWRAFTDGLVTAQDEASMLIAPLLQLGPETAVLDMCAGLGTKTTQILELQGATGHVTAIDIHHHKLDKLKSSAERLELSGLKTLVADARSVQRSRRHREAYDAVLLDAPCSGMGVLRRRPEIRWRRTVDESKELSALQQELLRAALAAVRPGGVVVYATCTLQRRENEAVVQAVLDEFSDEVVCEDILQDLPEAVRDRCQNESSSTKDMTRLGVTVTPEMFGTDGFYMARIRRLG